MRKLNLIVVFSKKLDRQRDGAFVLAFLIFIFLCIKIIQKKP